MTITAKDTASAPRAGGMKRKSRWAQLPLAVRRAVLVALIIAAWQLYVSALNVNPLLFASPHAVLGALWSGWTSGELSSAAFTTLRLLGLSMILGVGIAVVLVALANWVKIGEDFLILVSSMLNPLPSIAILPLAILWFGLSENALIFVVTNAIVWPVAINVHMGFQTANRTILAVGRNIGLTGWREVVEVLLPSSLPHIISGLKTALAFGWRTIVAAELVFGVAGGKGGVGYYINNARFFLRIPNVFAALITIAIIGLLIEMLFAWLERRTVIKWGMKSPG